MYEEMNLEELEHVGHETPRPDAIEKLTGQATFVSDMALPGMLHAQVKRSPYARAKILKIDTSAALALDEQSGRARVVDHEPCTVARRIFPGTAASDKQCGKQGNRHKRNTLHFQTSATACP